MLVVGENLIILKKYDRGIFMFYCDFNDTICSGSLCMYEDTSIIIKNINNSFFIRLYDFFRWKFKISHGYIL